MSNDNEDSSILPDEIDSATDTALDFVVDAFTGVSIPKPIKRNAFKAFGRLCSAAIEIPASYLEGIAEEKRAETQARVKLIETNANQIAAQMEVDPEYARVAVRKFGQKIIREQVNLDVVSGKAAALLDQKEEIDNVSEEESEVPEIDDDWLNQFEKEASQKSTEEMQLLFGKILAGEIRKPSSFSIKAVKTLGELDKQTADLFQNFCSLLISLQLPGPTIMDARVPSLGGNAGQNSLKEYGFGFDRLNTLQEYGLIISDYNSFFDYQMSIVRNASCLGFTYLNKPHGLVPSEEHPIGQAFKVNGVALSKVGKELFKIVDTTENEKFSTALRDFFEKQKLKLVQIAEAKTP